MKLGDQSPMPFGKYKDEPMEKVPASYLLFIWEDGLWHRGDGEAGTDERLAVHDYIKENFSALEMEKHDIVIKHRPE